MTAFDDALVSVLLADYIAVDPSGKFNVVGLGFQFSAIQPSGTTPAQYVLGVAEFPQRYAGKQVSATLELIDLTENGSVRIPGPSGQNEALRVEQLFTIDPPNPAALPGYVLPPEMPRRIQMVMGFTNGLPLKAGHQYEWRMSVDNQRRKGWVARFHVLQPVPPPVFGGQGGPSDIPNIKVDTVIEDDEATD